MSQGIVEIERLLAGDAEDVLDPLRLEALDEDVARSARVATLTHPMRQAITATPARRPCPGRRMHRLLAALLTAAALALLAAGPAGAASRFVIRGAGSCFLDAGTCCCGEPCCSPVIMPIAT